MLDDKELYEKMSQASNPYGDGEAAGRIIRYILFRAGLTNDMPNEFKS